MDEATLRSDVAQLRRLGADHRTIELKKARGGLPTTLWETISAFANADGGTIYLGVDEASDFAICGVADPSLFESQLGALCADLEPIVRAEITTVVVDDRSVVVAVVPAIPREQRPCHKRSLGEFAGSRLRVSDGDRKLTAYEVTLLLSARSEPRDDLSTVPTASLSDLDANSMAAYATRVRERSFHLSTRTDAELRRMTNLTRHDDAGVEVPTVAGLLAFGLYPQQFFPQLNVTVVAYPDNDAGATSGRGEKLLDNRPVDGSIPVMAQEAIRALKLNMRRRSIVSGLVRIDEWEYPEEALREALINALVHRDYSSSARGMQVQVEVYPDRLSIRNPGGLHGPVELGSLGERTVSSSRNRALLKIMEDTALDGRERMVCENRGTGIARMRRVLSDAGMDPPTFRDEISTFEVVFPNHTLLDQDTLDWLQELDGRPFSRAQMALLATMRNDSASSMTNSRFRTLSGVQDSRLATRELGELVDRGILVLDGTRGSATYRLASSGIDLESRTGRPRPPMSADRGSSAIRSLSDQQTAILEALSERELSRADLVTTTGLSSVRVASILQTLRERGMVEMLGLPRSRSARWRRIGQF